MSRTRPNSGLSTSTAAPCRHKQHLLLSTYIDFGHISTRSTAPLSNSLIIHYAQSTWRGSSSQHKFRLCTLVRLLRTTLASRNGVLLLRPRSSQPRSAAIIETRHLRGQSVQQSEIPFVPIASIRQIAATTRVMLPRWVPAWQLPKQVSSAKRWSTHEAYTFRKLQSLCLLRRAATSEGLRRVTTFSGPRSAL